MKTSILTSTALLLFDFCDNHAYQASSAYQSVSAYGLKLNETPNIDRLAREGMRFDNQP
jgi:arylsulfatase A-like enzyme